MNLNWTAVAALILFTVIATFAVADTASIRPFEIQVSESVLQDLSNRLKLSKFPTALRNAEKWTYGADPEFVKSMVDYWLNEYDWNKRQAIINKNLVNQFITHIEDLDIHFVHVKSPNPTAFPLIVSHGWPGSVLECTKIIPLLIPHFHIVCPSIPGYFFSEAPSVTGFNSSSVARVFAKLMARLGYDRYMAQGGDWGSEISRYLGIQDEHCVAIHLNMLMASPPLGIFSFFRSAVELILPNWMFDAFEIENLSRLKTYMLHHSAYMHYQSTLPDTLAIALLDSPAGLAAYLWEKYHYWSDIKNDSLLSIYTKDELVDFVMVYWITGCIGSSMRLYKETIPPLILTPPPFQPKPTAVANFKDILMAPRSWAAEVHNVVRWTLMPEGGHFAAIEQPDLLANDVIEYARSLHLIQTKAAFRVPEGVNKVEL